MSIPSQSLGLGFVPEDILGVMKKIHDAGFDVWLVGGALRDYFLGNLPKDWDLATSAGPESIMKLFPRVVPVGIRHGTVQVHLRSRDIEVTSFHPGGEAGILKDLGRRDLTMNALALSYPEGVLIDPHGGRADIKTGLIRAVGEARERFSEDPLRIVRTARMAGNYGFEVHPGTFEAMREEAENLERVSGERIRDELCKILLSPHVEEGFDLLRRSWVLGKMLPELVIRGHVDTAPGSGVSIYRHALLCVIKSPLRLLVRLAALLHESGVPADGARGGRPPIDYRHASAQAARERMKKWNMSNRQIEDVSALIERQIPPEAEGWSEAEIRRFLSSIRRELLEDFLAFGEAVRLADRRESMERPGGPGERIRRQAEAASPLRLEDLAVSGGDVMKVLGLKPGPEVGKVLRRLLAVVIEDPARNNHETLVETIRQEFRG